MNEKEYVIYNKLNGIIRQFVMGDEVFVEAQIRENDAYVLSDPLVNRSGGYIDISDPANPKHVSQGDMPYTVQGNTITDLPIPCRAIIEGESHSVTDGTVTLDTDIPGEYSVRISAVEYKPEIIEVVIP